MNSIIHFVLHLNLYLSSFVGSHGAWTYALLFFIVFCQTGVVVAAFLPGDSLLFAAGSIAALGALKVYILIPLLMVAAIAGNTVNYLVGDRFGHLLLKMNNHFFFKKSYIDKTHHFFEKHGAKAIILALFAPIIRTFTPFLAGVGSMRFPTFMFCNIVGVSIWVILLITTSFWFGNIPAVKNHFSMVILAIIFISVLPIFYGAIKNYLAQKTNNADTQATT